MCVYICVHVCVQVCVCVCMLSQAVMPNSLQLTYQAPLSMGFPRQEYWSRWPFPSWNLPDSGIELAFPASPALQKTWVLSQGWEDRQEKRMATHSSILAWRIPWPVEPGRLWSIGSQTVGYDYSKLAHMHTHICTYICIFPPLSSLSIKREK